MDSKVYYWMVEDGKEITEITFFASPDQLAEGISTLGTVKTGSIARSRVKALISALDNRESVWISPDNYIKRPALARGWALFQKR